jgi:hypothetical protein
MESIVLAIIAFAAGAAFFAVVAHFARQEPHEPLDWTEAAYHPRHDQPRAVTRIKSNSIYWEIN